MSIDILLPFLAASVLLTLAPGPDNLFVMAQAALYGRQAGILVTLGLCTGLLFHTTIAVLGISSVFLLSSMAFFILKMFGASYLLYLAWGAWRASAIVPLAQQAPRLGNWQFYRRGIPMNITNPKVGIFFIAFLPQFTVADSGPIPTQLLTLALLFLCQTMAIFSLICVLASNLAQWFRHSASAQRRLNRISAVIFASLALKLALTSR